MKKSIILSLFVLVLFFVASVTSQAQTTSKNSKQSTVQISKSNDGKCICGKDCCKDGKCICTPDCKCKEGGPCTCGENCCGTTCDYKNGKNCCAKDTKCKAKK
ncbi:MAG TPA: hypothetical protein PKW14_09810 [Bacteroidota bacterium]|nr:hypothetical protein [Bacteroidota bacterium]